MIIKLDKTLLFTTFAVESFMQLNIHTQVMAPSMIEYYLSDLASNDNQLSYINKSNIQQTIFLDDYLLYLDYNEDIYMEFVQKNEEYKTESLW